MSDRAAANGAPRPAADTDGPAADANAPRADANERFAQRLADELAEVLGVGIALETVSVEGQTPVTIQATCLVDGQVRAIVGSGETILEAARDLIRAAAELRLAAAWWRIVGPV